MPLQLPSLGISKAHAAKSWRRPPKQEGSRIRFRHTSAGRVTNILFEPGQPFRLHGVTNASTFSR